ncbi:MAG: WbuC family cupin fold metalloprotein [Candidatus Solibacter usitatus]|nr:WbuC family cupin fold metalloprotein [Candidatus Solibacter usitatus]
MQVQLIGDELFQEVLGMAGKSPRRRMNHNFHHSLEEPCHRFLNVLLRGTYVPPHRHVTPPKSEAFVVLEGQLAVFLFDDCGEVTRVEILGRGDYGDSKTIGIDVGAGMWHSMAVLTGHAVCYEVKPGPYAAMSDKDFAPWAPREGEPGTKEYLQKLIRMAMGSTE